MIVEIRDEVVALSGVLRRNQWPTLQSAVNVRLKYHPAGIIVDCSGLRALTPEGADTFRAAAQHIARSGARIVVASVTPDVMRVLRQVPNLRSQLPLAETVSEARASLGMEAPGRRQAGEAPGDIVVGLLGTDADADAVAVACRLSETVGGRIHLAYLLVVPRNVPLFSPVGSEEESARAALERLDNAVRLAHRTPIRRVERTRDRATRLVEVAAEARADMVVLALLPDASEDLVATAEKVLVRAPCDVVVDRLPEKTPIAVALASAPGGVR